MRYVKPPDFKSVKELERHFKDAEAKIAALLTDGSARSANELNARLQSTLSTAVSFLLEQAKAFSVKELLVAFEEGKNRAPAPRKGTARMAKEVLAAQGFKYAKNAFSRDTYIEIRQATVSAGKGLAKRVNATIAKLKKKGEDTVYNVQRAILEDMNEHGVLLVRYANGAKQPLSSYAAMAARSARIESSNIAEIGGALLAGSDLVEMTTMPGCCRLCGAYQGKVYSISGKDKRFPALFKTVLKNGYALPHPNCRHEFVAYFEEMEDPEDVKRKIQKSKIEYDGKGNLRDVREQKDIEAYQAWQAGNRQLRREELEYEEMRAYYEERNEKPPYATLGGYRRAHRAQSDSFRKMRHRIADFNRNENDSDRPIPLKQESIKGAKYEAKFSRLVPSSIVHTITVKSRQILRENNRKKEETAVCVSLGTGEVLLEQHAKGLVMEVDTSKLRGQPADSVIMTHNHPTGTSFSERDLEFMGNNPQIHTMIAVSPDGKVFSLRTNCGKMVDRYIVSEYNRYIGQGASREDTLRDLAKKYGWEYKEV